MKFIHIADLHLGKKVHGHDLIEEQKDALTQVIDLAKEKKVNGVLIAGDVYDTVMPPIEAVQLLDWFLSTLSQAQIPVFMISGNHDSAQRLGFASQILSAGNIYVAGAYDGCVPFVDVTDDQDTVRIHMLPFIKPRIVKACKGRECADWTEAVKVALEDVQWIEEGKNILISHQFYTGGITCDSELISVGTLDQVSASVLDSFDYAALGHLHIPQWIGKETNRYSGTLLKYSVSEIQKDKSITLLDVQKNGISIEEIPVRPLRDFLKIQGTYDELVARDYYRHLDLDQYFYIVLEDQQEVFNAFAKLQTIYPRILKIEYCNAPQLNSMEDYQPDKAVRKTPQELFQEFYTLQNGTEMDKEMMDLLMETWEEIHEAA